jgi:hypothetical protein
MQFRSQPTRNDDVARELRRRILAEMNLAGVQLVGAHRVTLLNSELNPMQSPQTSGNTQGG